MVTIPYVTLHACATCHASAIELAPIIHRPICEHARLLLGIDPGKTGAAVAIDVTGRHVHAFIPAGWKERGLHPHTIAQLRGIAHRVHAAALEETILYKDGAPAAMTARAIALSAGVWVGALSALGIYAVSMVRPQTWQARVKLQFPRPGKKASKAERAQLSGASKRASVQLAGAMYGAQAQEAIRVWGDGIADALLIAEWLRQEQYSAMYARA